MNYSLCFGIKGPFVPLEYTIRIQIQIQWYKYFLNNIIHTSSNTPCPSILKRKDYFIFGLYDLISCTWSLSWQISICYFCTSLGIVCAILYTGDQFAHLNDGLCTVVAGIQAIDIFAHSGSRYHSCIIPLKLLMLHFQSHFTCC